MTYREERAGRAAIPRRIRKPTHIPTVRRASVPVTVARVGATRVAPRFPRGPPGRRLRSSQPGLIRRKG